MTEINFQPVFDYIDNARVEILQAIRIEIANDLRAIRTDIANIVGQTKDHQDEMAIMGFRTNRTEKWAVSVGNKVGIPLDL